MKIDLKNYMDERDKARDHGRDPGPVITISREHGCDASHFAHLLAQKLSAAQHPNARKWECINKEILSDSAEELKVTQNRIRSVLDTNSENVFDGLFSSLTQHYGVSDKRILEYVEEVLWSYAVRGSVIIVGRSGAAIAKKIKKSLHVRLQAPLDWRIAQIQIKWGLSLEEAQKQCEEIDEKRNAWIEQLSKGEFSNSNYDLILNRKRLNDEELTDIVIAALDTKNIVKIPEHIYA